jgi:hypothetical protein
MTASVSPALRCGTAPALVATDDVRGQEPEPDDEGEEGEGAPQKATEKTELVAPGASEGVSALDALAQLDRQAISLRVAGS